MMRMFIYTGERNTIQIHMESSLEFLMTELYENGLLTGDGSKMDEILDKAKVMHENEMFMSFHAGQSSMEEGGKDFLQYFKDKFKK